MKMKKTIYLLDKKMSQETFDQVMSKFPDVGITPKHINEVLFGMLSDGTIDIWLDPEDKDDPIHIGTFPEVESYKLISTPNL